MACGDQRRLTGSGSALEVVLHDYALYKSTFTLLTLLYVNRRCPVDQALKFLSFGLMTVIDARRIYVLKIIIIKQENDEWCIVKN